MGGCGVFFFATDRLKLPPMVTQPMSMHLDARMHASNAGLPVEQVSKALPEIGTKNVGRRVQQMLV